MVGKGLSTAITVVTPFLLVRALTQEEFGLYKQIFLIYATLLQVIPFGVVPSLFYFVPHARGKRTSYIIHVQAFLAITAAIACVGLIVCQEQIAAFLASSTLQEYMVETAIFSGVMVLSLALEVVLIVDGRAQWSALVSVVSEITKSLGMLLTVVLFHNLHLMMWSLIGLATLRIAIFAAYLAGSKSSDEAAIDGEERRQFLLYALPFGAAVMMTVIQGSLDRYAVSAMVGAVGFAVYSVGMFQLPLVSVMQHALADVAIPKMTQYRREGQRAAILFTWQRAMIYLALVFVPVCLLLIVLRAEFIEVLFTAVYRDSVPIFAVGAFILPLSAMLEDAILRVYDDTRVLLGITIATCLVLLGALYPLVASWGLVGAALSSVLALLVNRLLLMWRSAQLLEMPLYDFVPWRDYAKVIVFSLVSAATAEASRHVLSVNALATVLLVSATFASVYLVLVMKSNLVPKRYKKELTGYFARLKPAT